MKTSFIASGEMELGVVFTKEEREALATTEKLLRSVCKKWDRETKKHMEEGEELNSVLLLDNDKDYKQETMSLEDVERALDFLHEMKKQSTYVCMKDLW